MENKTTTPDETAKMQGSYCCLYPLDLKKHSLPLYESFCKDKNNLNWTYLPILLVVTNTSSTKTTLYISKDYLGM